MSPVLPGVQGVGLNLGCHVGVQSAPARINAGTICPGHERAAELDRLGDEIARLSAHLEAATARLALILDFDARGGWHDGFPPILRANPRSRRRCALRATQ